jgi:hypothetical protein
MRYPRRGFITNIFGVSFFGTDRLAQFTVRPIVLIRLPQRSDSLF